jgi:hypothetical protein
LKFFEILKNYIKNLFKNLKKSFLKYKKISPSFGLLAFLTLSQPATVCSGDKTIVVDSEEQENVKKLKYEPVVSSRKQQN